MNEVCPQTDEAAVDARRIVRGKRTCLICIAVALLVMGAFGSEDSLNWFDLLATGTISISGLTWVLLDANLRGLWIGRAFCLGVALINGIFIPAYLIRSRGWGRGLGLSFVAVIVCMICLFVGLLVHEFFLAPPEF